MEKSFVPTNLVTNKLSNSTYKSNLLSIIFLVHQPFQISPNERKLAQNMRFLNIFSVRFDVIWVFFCFIQGCPSVIYSYVYM
jgi:hypothetical protein